MVAEAKLSGSNEEPEAGFDALMQSIVCEVRWNSFAILFFVLNSNSEFLFTHDKFSRGKKNWIVYILESHTDYWALLGLPNNNIKSHLLISYLLEKFWEERNVKKLNKKWKDKMMT